MKLTLILLILYSAVLAFTLKEEPEIFNLSYLLNPRQASENISAAIGVCLGDGIFGCPHVNNDLVACYYPNITNSKDPQQAASFQKCLCDPNPRKANIPAFPTALRTCLSCLVNNTLTTPHSTSALSVYINFCAASPTAVDLAAFLEEEPILIQLQNSWGVISTFTDTHGAGLLTQMPTVYAGPTSTIGVSKSLIGGGGKNSSSVKSTVEASPEPTVSASATPTGKKASAGRVDVRGWLAGVVGLVVFGVGFLFVD